MTGYKHIFLPFFQGKDFVKWKNILLDFLKEGTQTQPNVSKT